MLPSVVDAPHLRIARSLLESKSKNPVGLKYSPFFREQHIKLLNLFIQSNIASFDETYPVIFNIILWLMVNFLFHLFNFKLIYRTIGFKSNATITQRL